MNKMPRIVCFLLGLWVALPAGAELILVENGASRMPIVIFADAPPLTRLAADELALYIEKTSGARPEVLEGQPDPLPESAIWVGVQPVLTELFPEQDFAFQHPEEILIAANDKHLVIAGRDRWDPEHLVVDFGRARQTIHGIQQEYGTHNAVYTFLHDHLGVRWLWPGEMGEDVLKQEIIGFAPFSYRYHPQVRARGGLLAYSTVHRAGPQGPEVLGSGYWLRAQRLQLCDLPSDGGHGPWGGWWKRFHETNPEYFALQPDGTRGGGKKPYPSEGNIKMCHSNPDLLRQLLDDAEEELKQNPNQRVFNASPGDGWYSGHCICEHCCAWDHPDGEPRQLVWQGLSQTYVALSDRDVTFANRVARGLKERFPDKDLYVFQLAYGHSRPPPIAVVPDDNVIIGNVANFLFKSDAVDRGSIVQNRLERENFGGWGQVTKNNFWRPNTGSPVGFQWGMPDVPLQRTLEDMQFAAAHGWMGIYVDYVREHWSTQGPLYYLMAQLIWNPYQDGSAILKDYYRRAFGPAAAQMEAYWNYMEQLREDCYGTEQPGRADHDLFDYYNDDRIHRAAHLLNAANDVLGEADARYRERIDFVRAGLEFTRLLTENGRLARVINAGGDPDGTARAHIVRNWEALRAVRQRQPGAVHWRMFFAHGPILDAPPSLHRQVPAIVAP